MSVEGKYKIVKSIPLGPRKEDGEIKAGTDVYLVHDVWYMDGGMLDRSFQEDFTTLLKRELKNGWNYLKPTDF